MKNQKASSLFFLSFLLLIFSSSSAFNITKILSQYTEFATLNGLLSQTKLADEINRRQTITVLAIDNAKASALSGKPLDVVKKILSVHVVLDYYDVEKLTLLGVSNKTSTLTTLFQASGLADGQQGFINVSLVNEGEIAFGSAAKGGALNSKLVKSVAAQPFNISVIQITGPVQVPGIEAPVGTPPPKPSGTPVPVQAPKQSPASSPTKTVAPAPVPSKKTVAPTPSEAVVEVPVEAPLSEAPAADTPDSDAPVADAPEGTDDITPVSSPPEPEKTADAEAPSHKSKSAGSRREVAIGGGVVMAALVSCLVA